MSIEFTTTKEGNKRKQKKKKINPKESTEQVKT